MNAPIILLRPDRGRRAYRLRCCFRIEADHSRAYFEKARDAALNKFIADMGKQGWEYHEQYQPRVTGPVPYIKPASSLPTPRRIAAKDMLAGVMQGNKYRDTGDDVVQSPDPMDATEWWEYIIAAVFVHKTLMMDIPDLHKEQRGW